jgi:hypothetical protein
MRHVGNLEAKLEEAKQALQMANDYMKSFEVVADQLAHTKITEDDQMKVLETLFPIDENDTDRKKRNAMESREAFQVCMFAPDILKYKGTAYQMVQAASDFATHIAPQRMTSTFAERNFDKVLNGHITIDKTFEMMLQQMAAAKVA